MAKDSHQRRIRGWREARQKREVKLPATARIGLADVVYLDSKPAARPAGPEGTPAAAEMPIKTRLRCAGESHMGMVRQNNEDACTSTRTAASSSWSTALAGKPPARRPRHRPQPRARAAGAPNRHGEERIREAITVANNEICTRPPATPSGTEWLAS